MLAGGLGSWALEGPVARVDFSILLGPQAVGTVSTPWDVDCPIGHPLASNGRLMIVDFSALSVLGTGGFGRTPHPTFFLY